MTVSRDHTRGLLLKEKQSTHTVCLGLALNSSVFYCKILNTPELACTRAKMTSDEAIAELDILNKNTYRDSSLVSRLGTTRGQQTAGKEYKCGKGKENGVHKGYHPSSPQESILISPFLISFRLSSKETHSCIWNRLFRL